MSLPELDLPTIQNWSCHNCGGCCRQHGIYITDEEHDRIEKQNWTEHDGIPDGQPVFVKMGSWMGKRRWRLAHQPDGSCVFLNEQGLCRIHARFGEPAKPLACRVYPYAFHPRGKEMAISLRFSCPSVVSNAGRPLAAQKSELRDLEAGVLAGKSRDWPPPSLKPGTMLDWPDTLRIVNAIEQVLTDPAIPVELRLRRTVFWMGLIQQATFDVVRGSRLEELLELIIQAAAVEVPVDPRSLEAPSALGRMQFRLLAGHYARKDAYDSEHGSLRGRWTLLRYALRLTSGKGTLPSLQPCLKEVPFETLERSYGALPSGAQELFTRYFQVKVHSLHFCGAAYFHIPVVEGFYSLALMYPVVLWISRWLAASAGRDELLLADVQQAMAIADHHHGYSPAQRTWAFRRRIDTLSRQNDIARLCAWYSRDVN